MPPAAAVAVHSSPLECRRRFMKSLTTRADMTADPEAMTHDGRRRLVMVELVVRMVVVVRVRMRMWLA